MLQTCHAKMVKCLLLPKKSAILLSSSLITHSGLQTMNFLGIVYWYWLCLQPFPSASYWYKTWQYPFRRHDYNKFLYIIVCTHFCLPLQMQHGMRTTLTMLALCSILTINFPTDGTYNQNDSSVCTEMKMEGASFCSASPLRQDCNSSGVSQGG